MCKKLIFVLTLSLFLISSAGAATVNWDFENGDGHNFDLWSVQPAGLAIDDPTIAGDESLTGAGGAAGVGLPDAGMAWTVGPPDQFDGLAPVIEEGCHVVNGVLVYGPCNDPFGYDGQTPNSRGQTGYLNTYNLNQWGDNLHSAANDQIATSSIVTLDENAVLTVWSLGGGSGTHAPEYDPDPALMYTDGSSGIVVWSADEADMYTILATIHTNGQGTLTEDSVDLSAFAGKRVRIDVVDAFQGSWGWLAIDEIQIENAISKNAGFIRDVDDGTIGWDDVQIAHLAELGYSVTVIFQADIGSTFTIDDADTLDLLVISESIGSSSADPLIGTTTPVMNQEGYAWDNWSYMGESISTDWQTGTEVEIVNDTHPIAVAAGVSVGPMEFYSEPGSFTADVASNLAPGAESIVEFSNGTDLYAKVFAIDEGAELANGSASPNRVVGFSLSGYHLVTEETMTDKAWALYDAAINWLDPPAAPPTAAMIVNPADLSAGFDQAQKDRLEMLGYEVTVVVQDDVSGGVFTAADAETYDVLVVSESIGSSAANNLIGANVPMMHQESYGWSRHFFTTGLQKAWVPVDGPIDIVNDHAIIADAGLSVGPLDFFTAPTNATSDLVASLVPGAVNLAQVTVDANDFTLVFAIEAGTELADASLAANRIIGFSLPGTAGAIDASVMTDEAWAFFDAAIAWLDQ